MIKHAVNKQYTAYAWLLDEDGNPVTGGAASITVSVIDESENLEASGSPTEVDATNAPGLYKYNFTPDAVGFWKTFWDSAVPDANISGGEVIYVCDVEYDEGGTYSYPNSDTSEIEISEQFTTAWSTLTRRRTHLATQLDFDNIANDASAPDVTLRRYLKIDGTNWRKVDETTYTNATLLADPAVIVDPISTKQAYKITLQMSVGLTGDEDLPWSVIVKYEDLCS